MREAMRNADLAQLSRRKLDFMCGDCYSTSITVWSGGQGFIVHEMPEESGKSKTLFAAIDALYKTYEPAP